MNELIKQMLDNIESDNHAAAQEDFNSLISIKITDALDQRKQQIAKNLGMHESIDYMSEAPDTLDAYDLNDLIEFYQSEEFDQLDELSKTTLKSYLHKTTEPESHNTLIGRFSDHRDAVQGGFDKEDKAYTKQRMDVRHKGAMRAIKKASGGKPSTTSKYLRATLAKTKPNTHLDLHGNISGTVPGGSKERDDQRAAGVKRAINKL